MERFLKLLVEYRGILTAMFHQLIDELITVQNNFTKSTETPVIDAQAAIYN